MKLIRSIMLGVFASGFLILIPIQAKAVYGPGASIDCLQDGRAPINDIYICTEVDVALGIDCELVGDPMICTQQVMDLKGITCNIGEVINPIFQPNDAEYSHPNIEIFMIDVTIEGYLDYQPHCTLALVDLKEDQATVTSAAHCFDWELLLEMWKVTFMPKPYHNYTGHLFQSHPEA